MKQIIIGLGEVGHALQSILECDGYDINPNVPGSLTKQQIESGRMYQVLHIAFPFIGYESEPAEQWFFYCVARFAAQFCSDLIIIHSSVPVGTTDKCEEITGIPCVHSPVRGVHPDLEKGIRTFVKFFGGGASHTAAAIFREKGIKTMMTSCARETEALKLWDTTIYGWNILLQKEIERYCRENGLDFKMVYTVANATYNDGYAALGRPEYAKYILKHVPGPIGGHCVRENWELLESPISDISRELHARISDSEAQVE